MKCRFCDETPEGRPWILLNRFALGTGKSRMMTEVLNDEGEYLWEMHEDDEQEYATGHVLCWPICASLYIEARMVGCDHDTKEAR